MVGVREMVLDFVPGVGLKEGIVVRFTQVLVFHGDTISTQHTMLMR
jgi:hypothetical protein